MQNITIKFDAETTDFLRMKAEKRGITLGEYLDELVHECMKEALEYEKARLALMEELAKPFAFTFVDGRPPRREELYDRPRLR
jgi:hypothetical protein